MPCKSQFFRCATALTLLLGVLAVVCAGAQQPASAKPDTAEAHLGAGYEALKIERYDQAAVEFKAALALDPSLTERAGFPLGVSLFELHRAAEARLEFEILRHNLGDHPNLLYYLGRIDIEADDFTAATQELSKAATDPPFPDTAYYLGFAFLKQHDLTAAEKWLNAAKQILPRDSRVEFQLSKVYREQGRTEEAKQALEHSEELRKRQEDEITWRQDCARELERGGQSEAPTCRKLYDPDNADKLTSLGTIYGQHGNFDDALKCFQRAAELSSQSPQMQYNLALTYYQMNQFEKARVPLEGALRRWPDLFQLNALYGAVLAKLGQDSSAYQALRHAHDLNPQDSGTADMLYVAALQLGRKAQEARNYSDSLTYLREAARLRRAEAEPHRRMAEIYSITARAAEAAAEQQEADRLNKTSPN